MYAVGCVFREHLHEISSKTARKSVTEVTIGF